MLDFSDGIRSIFTSKKLQMVVAVFGALGLFFWSYIFAIDPRAIYLVDASFFAHFTLRASGILIISIFFGGFGADILSFFYNMFEEPKSL